MYSFQEDGDLLKQGKFIILYKRIKKGFIKLLNSYGKI